MTDHRTLIARARAALDEDERTAKEAHPGPWGAELLGSDEISYAVTADYQTIAYMPDRWARGSARSHPHIARHDPASVLAKVERLRPLIDRYEALVAKLDAATADKSNGGYDLGIVQSDRSERIAALTATINELTPWIAAIVGGAA